jgi:GMP synthase (glutamine-hydrolysing)
LNTESTVGPVLVVDFGAQYAQLIARRVREAHVFSEIIGHNLTAAEIAAKNPVGIIFSGGPASVHVDGAPSIDPGVYELGVPILGICYGAQLLARDLGGEVSRTDRGEYGRTELTVAADDVLFSAAQPRTQSVWMSHFDTITVPPVGATVTASTP